MFVIVKRLAMVICFLIPTACTINTEKVILNSSQPVDVAPVSNLSEKKTASDKTTIGVEESYVVDVQKLNTQQQIEIYQWLQKNESSLVLSVFKDKNSIRVRFKSPVPQDEFLLMIRQAGKLDELTYQIMFDGNSVLIKKTDKLN